MSMKQKVVDILAEGFADAGAAVVGALGLELGPFDIPVTLGVRSLLKAGIHHFLDPSPSPAGG